jgi:hypothetical protein
MTQFLNTRTTRTLAKALRKLSRPAADIFNGDIRPYDHAVALEEAAYARRIGDKRGALAALRDAKYIRHNM